MGGRNSKRRVQGDAPYVLASADRSPAQQRELWKSYVRGSGHGERPRELLQSAGELAEPYLNERRVRDAVCKLLPGRRAADRAFQEYALRR